MWITLNENLTTGYRWDVFHSDGVQVVEDHHIPPISLLPNGERLAGGGGWRVLRLRGAGNIILHHHQPWDPKSTIDVKVIRVYDTQTNDSPTT